MKAGTEINISKYTLLALFLLIAVVLVLFFFVGFGNQVPVLNAEGVAELNPDGSEKTLREPIFTQALIYLMYFLTVVPILYILINGLVNSVMRVVAKPVETLKSWIAPFTVIVLFVVAYCIAKFSDANTEVGDPLLINGVVCEDYGSMVLTDFFLYVQYVLLTLCVLVTIISLTGVTKLFNKVKE